MSLVKGFESPTADDFRRLWEEGMFVLDTSVLLNLHRYRDAARIDILAALTTIKDRLWIPYHVALEYERNRLTVLAKSRSNIKKAKEKILAIPDTVRGSLNETDIFRRHSFINVDTLMADLRELSEKFAQDVTAIYEAAPDVNKPDKVRDEIEALLSGRIGPAPSDQKEVEKISASGNRRFEMKQPPGYMDQLKSEGRDKSFAFAGLVYESRFGDLYVWEQIKSWARSLEGKPVCFVTDDQKEDWWWVVDSEGQKRIGPRAELKEEMHRESGVHFFHIYGPDSFLEGMNQYKHAGINPDSVSEAREISEERLRTFESMSSRATALEAVAQWLRETHSADGSIFTRSVFPDVLRLSSGQVVEGGYEVYAIKGGNVAPVEDRLREMAPYVSEFAERFPGAELHVVFVTAREHIARRAFERAARVISEISRREMKVVIGHLDASGKFVLHATLS